MMATTHVLAGLALVAPVARVAPEFALPLSVGAIVGGFAPDVDVLFEHRRTLHFPLLGGAAALPFVAVVVLVPTAATVGLAAVAVTAWLHAASDAVGGGPELDPWSDPSDRAVYDHRRSRWIRPRRWIRYDGAPEDALLAVALAIPGLVIFDGPVRAVVGGMVVASIGYALVRRRLVEWAPEWLE